MEIIIDTSLRIHCRVGEIRIRDTQNKVQKL